MLKEANEIKCKYGRFIPNYEFESPNDRDITLEDRLETFYPNVSLCDSGCKSTGVNLTSMKAICSCTFTDISKADILACSASGIAPAPLAPTVPAKAVST